MQSLRKASTRFQPPSTPRRGVIGEIGNYSPTTSPQKLQLEKVQLENRLQNVLLLSARKDVHIDCMEAQYSKVEQENENLNTHRSVSSSSRKLLGALDDNARQDTYITHLEEELSKAHDRIDQLEIELDGRRFEICKLNQETKDCNLHLKLREEELKDLLEELEKAGKAMDDRALAHLEKQAQDDQERADYVGLNRKLRMKISRVSGKVKEMNKTAEADKEELKTLHVKFKEQESIEQTLIEDNKVLKLENTALRQQLTAPELAAFKLATSNDKLATTEKALTTVEEKLTETETKPATSREKMEVSNEDPTAAAEKCLDLSKEIEDIKDRLVAMSIEAAEEKNKNNVLEEKLAGTEKERRRLEAELATASLKLDEAQDVDQQVIEPCLMMRENTPIISDEVYPDYPQAPLSPVLASPPAIEPVRPWRWLSRVSSVIIAKKDDAKTDLRLEMSVRGNDYFEEIMGTNSSGSQDEVDADMAERREEDDNDPTRRVPSGREEKGREKEPSIHTDEEKSEGKNP
ncbi:hypothetical protein FKW77_001038 [Venturia effusa]|uniref:Uncharacterized protein n=1 Tax=Venturia effusa TaxID=50376 RepID=A0A517LJT0_9PEZI|nr:hypothetical protein FKW77_001038 [Venturia effusa]